jgi:hypothetical protein
MSVQPELARLSVSEFRDRIRNDLVPLGSHFSYFSIAPSLPDEDLRDYLQDPLAALPPALLAVMPKVAILLVPHLERANLKGNGAPSNGTAGGAKRRRHSEPRFEDFITFDRPAEGRGLRSSLAFENGEAAIALAVQEQEIADYHYELYHQIASLASEIVTEEQLQDFRALLREELVLRVHGEVDERSWQLKQALQRRQVNMKRDTKGFRHYSRTAFIDTMTLYLHGLCCDIDVETGPRQIASRYLRRRLRLLSDMFPPPEGFAVFPEDLDNNSKDS